jgi:putative ABC transport system ATP-binding protein/lipoprotein-releasing system ATP-binding protein
MIDHSTSSVIRAHGIRRSYRIGRAAVPVLHGVDLDVRAGEVVFLRGPSGAGKTTLLYILAGLEKPDAGEVEIEGEALYTVGSSRLARRRNTRMGYLFQHFFLMPELTALENVLLPAFIGGHDRSEAAGAMLDKVGLGHRLHHLPAELSGGEQQRVALARALVNDPAILFADEPTGNLDSRNGAAIMELLLGLARDQGRTLVVVTHDANLAAKGDRQLEMRDGKIIAG